MTKVNHAGTTVSISRRNGSKPNLRFLVLLLFAGLVIAYMFVNYAFVTSISVGSPRARVHPPPNAFPKFVERKKMSFDQSSSPLEWDAWADPPYYGSFQYSSTSSVHFPYQDLQSFFHNTKPDFSVLSNGLPRPQVLKGVQSPDSDFVLLTRKGNKFATSGVKANQDRAAILSPFFQEGDWWLGLFDGHGNLGHVVSHHCVLEFPRLLHKRIEPSSSEQIIVQQLNKTFIDIHMSLPDLDGAGTTGISMLKLGENIYVSNVGDSEALIVSYDRRGKVEIVFQTTPHKPDLPEEKARIEAAGGFVLPSPFPGASARHVVNLANGMQMALAMSRSIGDNEGDPFGHSAEPKTDTLHLKRLMKPNRKYMAIAASDGIFDKIPLIEMARYIVQSMMESSKVLPLEAAEQLIIRASDLWRIGEMDGYRDDITLVAHTLTL